MLEVHFVKISDPKNVIFEKYQGFLKNQKSFIKSVLLIVEA